MPARRALASLRRRRISAIGRTCSSSSTSTAVSKGECDDAAVDEDVVSGLDWFWEFTGGASLSSLSRLRKTFRRFEALKSGSPTKGSKPDIIAVERGWRIERSLWLEW